MRLLLVWTALLGLAGRAWSLEPTLEQAKQDSGLRFMENVGAGAGPSEAVWAGGAMGDRAAMRGLMERPRRGVVLDEAPIPAPETRKEDLERRYERKGEGVGLAAGAAAGAALGAVAGAPSVVGAVAAALLLGYLGGRAGVIAGKYAGRGAAAAQIAAEGFVRDLKQFAGSVKTWWEIRPRWGQPY